MPHEESSRTAPTAEKLSELERVTDVVKANCAQLCALIFRIYGDKDNRTLRAEEIAASTNASNGRADTSGEAANASG